VVIPKGVWKRKDQLSFYQRNTDNQSGSIYLNYDEQTVQTLEVDSLDNILSDCGVSEIHFIVIQLNGAELEALQGLTKFTPHHLAIAARYDTTSQTGISGINNLLEERGYQVKNVEGRFLFARLEDK